jgi:hypothetical protein
LIKDHQVSSSTTMSTSREIKPWVN